MTKHIEHWNYIFDALNNYFWNDKFRSVPVFLHDAEKDMLGNFQCTPEGFNSILLSRNQGLSDLEMLGVLLHEMCHHVAFEKHGIAIEPHGHEWQAEMKHVGFTKDIDELTDGCNRFNLNSAQLFFDHHFEKIENEL
jgi:hypothetical protein